MKYSHGPPEVVCVKHEDWVERWVYESKTGYVPLDEAYLARASPGFRNLNERAREKARDAYLATKISSEGVNLDKQAFNAS